MLICGLEEGEGHVHNGSCYGIVEEPACGLEESTAHIHEGHIHTEECYEVSEILICEQEKHGRIRMMQVAMAQTGACLPGNREEGSYPYGRML